MARRGRLPTSCPSCGGDLRVVRLACPGCGTAVHGDYLLPALARLDAEDRQFALAFILHSGSLKEMARLYGVSYPTVRNRLDDLSARLRALVEAQESAATPGGAIGAAAGGAIGAAAGGDTDAAGDDR